MGRQCDQRTWATDRHSDLATAADWDSQILSREEDDTLAARMHAFCGLQGDLGGDSACLRGARERAPSALSKRRERGLRIASEMQ